MAARKSPTKRKGMPTVKKEVEGTYSVLLMATSSRSTIIPSNDYMKPREKFKKARLNLANMIKILSRILRAI